MESKVLSHEGNNIQMTFTITQKSVEKHLFLHSPKYRCGGVDFQILVDSYRTYSTKESNLDEHLIVSAQITKIFNDKLSYICKLSSVAFETPNVSFSEDKTWHKVYTHISKNFEATHVFTFKFDMNVNCDLAPSTGPFALLYDDTSLNDFELRGEGGTVPVHRVVLAACSPVLKQMLSRDWKETKEGHVTVADATKETLENFKNYIYLHKLPEKGIEQLLLLGSFYMMPDLVQKCLVKLLNTLNHENLIDLAEFAAKFKVTQLFMYILNIIQSGIIEIGAVPTTDNWMEMCEGMNAVLEK